MNCSPAAISLTAVLAAMGCGDTSSPSRADDAGEASNIPPSEDGGNTHGLPICPGTLYYGAPSNPVDGCDGDAAAASQCYCCTGPTGETCGCDAYFRDAASEAAVGWGCLPTEEECFQ